MRCQIAESEIGNVRIGIELSEALEVLLGVVRAVGGTRCIAERDEREAIVRIDLEHALVGADRLFRAVHLHQDVAVELQIVAIAFVQGQRFTSVSERAISIAGGELDDGTKAKKRVAAEALLVDAR